MIWHKQNILLVLAQQITLKTHRHFAAATATTIKKSAKSRQVVPKQPINDIPVEEPINPYFLLRTVGVATMRHWQNILQQHPELMSVKRQDISNVVSTLKSLNYPIAEILARPMILYTNASTLENRHIVLSECGFEPITLLLLVKFVTVMNKTIAHLKAFDYLPAHLDVLTQLKSCFHDMQLELPADFKYSDELELKALRLQLMNCYLRQCLLASETEIQKIWKVYGRLRHRNFQAMQAMVQLLRQELNFDNERIIKNAYLLYGDAENVKRIIAELPSIDGQNICDILWKRPKIMMNSCSGLLNSLQYIKSFGIEEKAIVKCSEVLTLGPDTILERLRDLNEIEEFRVLASNPRVLRLVHYQNKARLRLEYLSQLKLRCASLHILSADSDSFTKFARDGSDRNKGCDVVVFLANKMQKPEADIRAQLSRHPNWCHLPVLHIQQCYEFLRDKSFSIDDIYANIHLLLYPIKRIEEKMHQLQTAQYREDMRLNIDMNTLQDRELLTLILYFIECDFHFTGDGIWTDQHTVLVENFHNLLPDFPEISNKVYKYGMKPANSSAKLQMSH